MPSSEPAHAADVEAEESVAGRRFTLFRLLRAFLAVNLAMGFCIFLNSFRAGSVPEACILPGPLWLAVNGRFTEFSPCGMTIVVSLVGAMVSPMIWPRWWTAAAAILAGLCRVWIGMWVAAICSC